MHSHLYGSFYLRVHAFPGCVRLCACINKKRHNPASLINKHGIFMCVLFLLFLFHVCVCVFLIIGSEFYIKCTECSLHQPRADTLYRLTFGFFLSIQTSAFISIILQSFILVSFDHNFSLHSLSLPLVLFCLFLHAVAIFTHIITLS